MTEHPTHKAVDMGTARLRHRCQRLLSLLNLQAPEVVLANEVLLIQEAAGLALGEHLYLAACRRDVERLRRAAGLCRDCDQQTGVGAANGLCEQCEAKVPTEA